MPNAPDVHKTQLVLRLERTLKRRMEREASAAGLTVTDLVNRILRERLSHVRLSSEDLCDISDRIKQALARRD